MTELEREHWLELTRCTNRGIMCRDPKMLDYEETDIQATEENTGYCRHCLQYELLRLVSTISRDADYRSKRVLCTLLRDYIESEWFQDWADVECTEHT